MEAAAGITAGAAAAPDSLRALLERFAPDVFDAPAGSARLRLTVRGEASWDALIGSGSPGDERWIRRPAGPSSNWLAIVRSALATRRSPAAPAPTRTQPEGVT